MCPFEPNTGNAAKILMKSQKRYDRFLGESVPEKVERLAVTDKQTRDAVKAAVKREYYSQYKFQPEICQTSKKIGMSCV